LEAVDEVVEGRPELSLEHCHLDEKLLLLFELRGIL
jgi:hypothetical protein